LARRIVQALAALIYNIDLKNFLDGKINKGILKSVCVPGLNCYSCPGAVSSCPIGSLQAVIGSAQHKFSLYLAGFLIIVGTIFGRFICGWVCPFGLIQELLYKIPGKKVGRRRIFGVLKYLKYAVLLIAVLAIPAILLVINGYSSPTFCAVICPAGTLEAGIPLVLLNKPLQAAAGLLFAWKVALLIAVVALSIVIFRPFCRFLCPLGAIYALMNRISVLGLKFDAEKCVGCGACEKSCGIGLDPTKDPNSPECVRCGACVKACPTKALAFGAVRATARRKPGTGKCR
jgi:polyferredoxin